MKKAIYAITMLVGSLMAVSCQSDSEYAQQTSQPMVIKATAERVGGAVSRTQMDYGYDVLWNEGDEICVKGYRNMHHYFKLVDGAGTPYGTFECNSVSSAQGSDIEALYPRSLWNGSDFIWPANQTKTTVMPMYCHQVLTEKYLTFKSLGGIMQIVFMKNFQATFDIKTVKVEDGEKTLSGAFTVDEEGKAVITATNKAGITLEANVENLGWGACIMNVALPAGTYNSLKLTFTDKDGRVFVRIVGEPVTISHNGITKLNVLGERFKDISPSTGTAKAIIDGKEVDVPWVRLWWKGVKFAAYNVGVVDYEKDMYGGYYHWGDTEDRYGKYKSDDEYKHGTEPLTGQDDTATALWGDSWRMMTRDDYKKLAEYCTTSWVCINDTWGMKFTSKTEEYADNLLFFPASGFVNNQYSYYTPKLRNEYGHYWLSENFDIGSTWAYEFVISNNTTKESNTGRMNGMSVRAVLKE